MAPWVAPSSDGPAPDAPISAWCRLPLDHLGSGPASLALSKRFSGVQGVTPPFLELTRSGGPGNPYTGWGPHPGCPRGPRIGLHQPPPFKDSAKNLSAHHLSTHPAPMPPELGPPSTPQAPSQDSAVRVGPSAGLRGHLPGRAILRHVASLRSSRAVIAQEPQGPLGPAAAFLWGRPAVSRLGLPSRDPPASS